MNAVGGALSPPTHLPSPKAGAPRGRLSPGIVLPALLVVTVLSAVCALAFGSEMLPVSTVVDVVHSRFGGPPVTRSELAIVWGIRAPRVLLGLAVGAGLAVAGAVVQTLVRNALADPHLLGVSSGASVGATAVITTGLFAGAGVWALSFGAMIGALGAAILVFTIATLQGGITPLRLVLTGTVTASALSAIASFLVLRTNDSQAAQSVLFWLLGSLAGASWDKLWAPVIVVFLLTAAVFALHGWLDALAAGPDVAASLGIPIRTLRNVLFGVLAALVGTMVAVSGAIAFVGLVIPHVTRMLVGARHRVVLPAAALIGASFLVWVDVVARTSLRPTEIPLSVVTGVIGAPLFLLLLGRRRYRFGGSS
ncbi:MAG: transporter permease [Rhodococcus erythropolis]|jgi:iron complex transport system permease protein|nr:iron ABC transporter permease [Rhodococcus sp. MS13]AGT90866.1 ABC transporter permease [Rhodococcus erythropolis CCM2595]MCS4252794.1 iron complex transport system permease protein [Rhodococcus erythropolis]OQM83924.1 putative ABC transporter permease protein [Rhodococcus sp. 66b]MCW2299425.1 iron complex transport system permease protein [Rhodococcus erythropolis]MCW2428762.1 iron complex transport system permease protein [Rhodococcus erythropolis]